MKTVKGKWAFNSILNDAPSYEEVNFTVGEANYVGIQGSEYVCPVYALAYLEYSPYEDPDEGWIEDWVEVEAYYYEESAEYEIEIGWAGGVADTIDFGEEEQEVSDGFYDWLVENATHIGNTIINITKNGTTTLATAGKYCDRNIDVNVEVDDTPAYEAGQKAEYDRFWNSYQKNGSRKYYDYAFAGEGWNDESFKPKYNIVPDIKSDALFLYSKIKDLKACLESCGVILDLSKSVNTTNVFAECYELTTLPKINLSSSTKGYAFYGDNKLETIEELKVSEKSVFTNYFGKCVALENMIVTGTIAQNGFDVKVSTKLSKASIESIVNALSSTTSGLTVTISKTAKEAAFTDAEWSALIATKSNWNISLV